MTPNPNIIRKVILAGGGIVPFDPDAQAYFNAAGITDSTEKSAANTLILDLKYTPNWVLGNAWDRGIAWYLISPTSMAAALINAKSPGTFDMTAVNTPTHSSTGIDFNGTNQYLRTGIIPNTDLSLNDMSLGYYSRENVLDEAAIEMGCVGNPSTIQQILFLEYNDALETGGNLGNTNERAFFDVDNSQGFVIVSRITSTFISISRNGSELNTNLNAQTGSLSLVEIYIGCYNSNGVATAYTTKETAFAFVCDGLTEAEITTLNTLVQAYQNDVIPGGRGV